MLAAGQESAFVLHASSGLQARRNRHVRDEGQNRHAAEIVRIAGEPAQKLRHRLDEQHARDERGSGEVRLEKRLGRAERLDPRDAAPSLQTRDPVDEQEAHQPSSQAPMQTEALWPPNPKELLSAIRWATRRDSFGT